MKIEIEIYDTNDGLLKTITDMPDIETALEKVQDLIDEEEHRDPIETSELYEANTFEIQNDNGEGMYGGEFSGDVMDTITDVVPGV